MSNDFTRTAPTKAVAAQVARDNGLNAINLRRKGNILLSVDGEPLNRAERRAMAKQARREKR